LKIQLTLLVLFFSSIGAIAQKAEVAFKSKVANFGKVKELAKQVHWDFVFTNTGSDPVRIDRVETTCGCTATEYTTMAIPKDSVGRIRVIYNTINRPGEFTKTVSVYFKGFNDPEILTIKGVVIGTQRLYDRELVFPIGNLRFQSRVISLKTVRTKEPERREFEFFNAGKKDISIKNIISDTAVMKVTFDKTTLKPREAGRIKLVYNALGKKDWGLVMDTLWLITTDDTIPTKPIPLATHIEEYFPPMNAAALEKAPKIKFEKTDYAFGSAKEGNTVSFVYKFTNDGKQELIIRKIVPGCICMSFEIDKYKYMPGEIGTIKVSLNTSYREGIQNKNVTVISNSPTTPSQNLWIRGNIVD